MTDETDLDIQREWPFEHLWQQKDEPGPIFDEFHYLPTGSKRELYFEMMAAIYQGRDLTIIDPKADDLFEQ